MDIVEYKQIDGQKNYWWFAEKNNLISRLLAYAEPNSKILDIGSGIGNESYHINKMGTTFLLDINPENLKYASNNLKVCADAENLPFKNNVFDTITLFDVLEHLKKDDNCVKQAWQVLKNNGYLITMVPAFQFMFSSHDEALGHIRRYNKAQFIGLFKGLFTLKRVTYWNTTLLVPISTIRLIKKYLKTPPALDLKKVPDIVNKLLSSILRLENFLISSGINLPVGLSLVIIAQKKDGEYNKD